MFSDAGQWWQFALQVLLPSPAISDVFVTFDKWWKSLNCCGYVVYSCRECSVWLCGTLVHWVCSVTGGMHWLQVDLTTVSWVLVWNSYNCGLIACANIRSSLTPKCSYIFCLAPTTRYFTESLCCLLCYCSSLDIQWCHIWTRMDTAFLVSLCLCIVAVLYLANELYHVKDIDIITCCQHAVYWYHTFVAAWNTLLSSVTASETFSTLKCHKDTLPCVGPGSCDLFSGWMMPGFSFIRFSLFTC